MAGLTLSREGIDQQLEEVACSSSRQVLVAAQMQPVAIELIQSDGSAEVRRHRLVAHQ
ncbi:MAG: hypothetical protein U0176_12705 [Bacteroidia bacterium]